MQRLDWQSWFAWHPVVLRGEGGWAFLQFVERKWDDGSKTGEPHWRYRRAKELR